MTIFIDSSFLFALFNDDDEFHQKAVKTAKKLEKKAIRFLISNIVIAEAVNLAFRLKGVGASRKMFNLIEKSGIEKVFVDQKVYSQAYDLLFIQKSKRGLNFFDCLHLSTMKYLNIENILTFDRAFEKEVKVID
ncbi:PIN domain-containing protein [Candidatus Shapirobacteria bacterium]|nr:PIN domain-containing protein [Candidatus Shapirobacteria bacterium]